LDERALKYFEVVVQARSIRRASDILHVAPSAISRKICALEKHLGVRLLDRMGRKGVEKTGAGDELIQYIKELRLREDDFLGHLSDLNELRVGTLRVASGGGFISDLITNVLTSFSKQYPGIRYILNVCPGDEVLRRVRDDGADLGLLLSYPSPASTVRIPQVETFLSCSFQPLSLIVNSQDPLSKLDDIAFPQLQSHTLALLNDSFIINHLIRTFEAQHHIRLRPMLECDSFDSITAFLLAGLGVSILPAYCVSNEIKNKTLTAIPLKDVRHNNLSFELVVNTEREHSDGIIAFSEHMRENMLAFNSL
jgi:DNA-binding transcriptional LysR family regulator